jgi:hypothetical protein
MLKKHKFFKEICALRRIFESDKSGNDISIQWNYAVPEYGTKEI